MMNSIKSTLNRKVTIKCGNKTFQFGTKTYIMGILNITPDSFSDGGNYFELYKAIEHANEMIKEGADIIDVGGESTRPGADEVDVKTELKRVLPIVEKLVAEVNIPISVDTYKAEVAEKVLEAGAHMINDVWGLQREPQIANIVAKYNVPVVIMHNQKGTEYKTDIMESIKEFLKKSIQIAKTAGIQEENIIVDPGLGFGKNFEQNIEVMSRLGELNELGYPILLGTSRKSMIGKILDLEPKARVEGTLSTTVMGIIQGVDMVRVHDIKENFRTIKVTDKIVRS
ncbi:dihydropteroate synthase [Natranaerovirga pectinivora]|uniref:Dihydropteroate synthase n=2 Tax=Natranaerovirga pectinivora TaxID=682400 RepID=A0A4V2V045_9FIRM|nr:dihydropteroate synthase [Natranaerovirga pectinivora]